MIQAEDTARLYAIAEQFLQTLQYTPHGKFWPAAILFHGREKTVLQNAPFPAFGIYEDGRIVCCAAPSAATYFRGFSELCVYTVPAYRNRGYGTQCIRAMTSAVCAAGRRVLYRTDVSNVAASHTAQAAGLHYAGNAHILLYARQT